MVRDKNQSQRLVMFAPVEILDFPNRQITEEAQKVAHAALQIEYDGVSMDPSHGSSRSSNIPDGGDPRPGTGTGNNSIALFLTLAHSGGITCLFFFTIGGYNARALVRRLQSSICPASARSLRNISRR